MHRFYAESAAMPGETVRLSPEDSHHALRVLRMREGEACEVFAGQRRFEGRLTAAQNEAGVKLLRELPSTEAKLRITLFQGLPKADKMDWIAQKATELGVDALVPVAMSRSVVRLTEADAERKQARWQKIAREAGKQSGRCEELKVLQAVSFRQMLGMLNGFDAAAVPWEEAQGYALRQFAAEHPAARRMALVIGPEGGISPEEIEEMKKTEGLRAVTLGPRILRTETAGLCAVSALMCLYGEME